MTAGYQALRESAAWFDITDRVRIRLTGEDRLRLLHALATNIIEGLKPGQHTETFFLSPQGRIVAHCRVYVDADSVLLETDTPSRQRLLDYLDQYIIMDDVTVLDETDSTVAVAVEGPSAGTVPEGLSAAGKAYPSTLTGLPGYWIQADRKAKDALLAGFEEADIPMAEPIDWETVRVENRIPVHGKDYAETNIPHETQLLKFVSFKKGCYVGQEIVERVNSQGQVNRLLTAVELESSQFPENLDVTVGGRAVGRVTSPVLSPRTSKIVGFTLVRRDALAPGAEILVDGKIAHTPPWP